MNGLPTISSTSRHLVQMRRSQTLEAFVTVDVASEFNTKQIMD